MQAAKTFRELYNEVPEKNTNCVHRQVTLYALHKYTPLMIIQKYWIIHISDNAYYKALKFFILYSRKVKTLVLLQSVFRMKKKKGNTDI